MIFFVRDYNFEFLIKKEGFFCENSNFIRKKNNFLRVFFTKKLILNGLEKSVFYIQINQYIL